MLANWDPASRSTPRPFLHLGTLVVGGDAEESDGLRVDLPPAPMRTQVDRWDILRERSSNGWISLGVFIDIFKIKYTGKIKHAIGRQKKKLLDAGCEVQRTQPPEGVGWPPPRARVSDLRRVHKDLQ